MKKSIYYLTLLLLLIACKKDGISPVLQNRTLDEPDVYDGMLWFNDVYHLDEYYEYLDDIADNAENIDSTLSLIEDEYNYTSLRSVCYGDGTLDDRTSPAEDYISDPVRLSIYNEDYEIRIGDRVLIKYSKNQTFSVHVDSTDMISRFRNHPRGQLTDSMPYSIIQPHVQLLSPIKQIYFSIVDSVQNPPIEPRNPPFNLMISEEDVPCHPNSTRMEFKIIDGGEIINNGVYSDFDIDWGDGTSESCNDVLVCSKVHEYPDNGDYTITVRADFTWFGSNYHEEGIWGVSGGQCGSIGEQHIERENQNGDVTGSRRLRSKIWYVYDIMGQHVGSKSVSFQKNSNGNWRRKNAFTIDALIDAQWRYYECDILGDEEEYQEKITAREVRVSDKIGGRCNAGISSFCLPIMNGDIFSEHKITFSTGSISRELVIEPCQ